MNAVIYARYSSDNQREESIEGQLRECSTFADKRGLTIIHHYIDRALSAKTDNRPEFQNMVKDSAKGQFDVVLVWKLDRFSRSRVDSAVNKMVLKKNGVRVVSATESISDGPEGILMEAVLEGYAEFYSAELAEKINRGLTENALKCKHNGAPLPMGYKSDTTQQYLIDPITAPLVQEIFTRYADGEPMADIAASLNERGLKTSKGNPFTISSLSTVLTNRKYMGEYRYKDIVQEDAMPAIISKELFAKAQVRRDKNRRAPATYKAKVDYLLSTKLLCGKCGAFMTGESGTGRQGAVYHYYKCGHAKRKGTCNLRAVKKDWIERLVVEETTQYVLQDDVIDRTADAIIAYQNKENALLPILQEQLRDAEKAIRNMLAAIEQGIITPSTKQRLEELEAQKEELEIAIAQEKIGKLMLTKEQIVFWISRFRGGDVGDPEYQKKIIDIFVNAVYVYDDKLVLFYNYKDGTKTITFAEIEGSDLCGNAPPPRRRKLHIACDDFFTKSPLALISLLLLFRTKARLCLPRSRGSREPSFA